MQSRVCLNALQQADTLVAASKSLVILSVAKYPFSAVCGVRLNLNSALNLKYGFFAFLQKAQNDKWRSASAKHTQSGNKRKAAPKSAFCDSSKQAQSAKSRARRKASSKVRSQEPQKRAKRKHSANALCNTNF